MFVKNQDSQLIELELVRFPKPYRRRLRRLVTGSPALCDVLRSFPAAAFALVSGYGSVEQRGQAVAMIKSGAALKDVAGVLALPVWTRKLPPEAFTVPLVDLPHNADFGRRLINQLPNAQGHTDLWLRAVLDALRVGDERFALWVGAQKKLVQSTCPARFEAIWLLAAFAFASQNVEAGGHAGIAKRWSKGMTLRTAQSAASEWAVRLIRQAERQPVKRGPGRYSMRNRQAGFAIVVLQTAEELDEEGRLMDHCVGTYGRDVALGYCMIFGIRQDGQRIATMEVQPSRKPDGLPQIAQLQGPGNSRVSTEIWERARMWLLQHASNPVAGSDVDPAQVMTDDAKWRALWAPHVAAVPAAFPNGQLPRPHDIRHAAMLLQHMSAR
ncbi:MAG: PcfJ domain-containing protein [Pseudomonadota bacterium]